jgi:CheY-like chemotaxis protein
MRKARILVLDDEEPLTRILKLHLEHTQRYEVRVENHGARALAAAREFRPDLVLLDVLMPDRTGQEIWEELRADPELRDVAVLFLTATVREPGSRDEPGSGRVTWIPKPVHAALLIEQIERQLQARGDRRHDDRS